MCNILDHINFYTNKSYIDIKPIYSLSKRLSCTVRYIGPVQNKRPNYQHHQFNKNRIKTTKMITKEEKIELYKYESMFNTAINQNYVGGVTLQAFNLLLSIYQEQTGDKSIQSISCSHCVLQLFKRVGKIYNEYIEEEVKEEEIKEPVKKPGRPKKEK